MLRSDAVAPHLPFLRRYARALTGNQASGDSYVRMCLEALVEDPEIIAGDLSPRVGLYRLFHAIWASASARLEESEAEGTSQEERTAQARLNRLIPEQRQALLLTALEGFSRLEVSKILGKTEAQIAGLIETAMSDLSREISTEVLIIEDEPIIALDLVHIVEELGHHVTQIATTRKEATAAAAKKRPGLVLADIQLADNSSGIDAVKDILGGGGVPVIFITAYPERLLTGERPEPTFLITKPFVPDAVKAAISQALFFFPPERSVAA